MKYNYLKFHEIVNYEIGRYKYLGIGYHLDYFYNIQDEALRLDTVPFQLTPHFIYSELYGFDPSGYTLSGLSLNFVFDSRDNLINPYKGYYLNLNYRYNPTFLGSSRNSSSLWFEFRTYRSLSKQTPRHLVGFWFFGNLRVSGRQPYMTLMALGEDQRARSGRGYIAGRFRGESMLYGEVEYRFPISKCSGILGGVVFVNATTVSNDTRNIALFDHVRPGAGIGLRVMLNKNFRTNINLDFGVGNKSQGFYFSGTETF
jgi:outer membrane protein assembly factor BamA